MEKIGRVWPTLRKNHQFYFFSFIESWLRLFSVIMDLMRRGYPDVELTLTSEEKLTIRTTWDAVQKEVEQVSQLESTGLFKITNEPIKISLLSVLEIIIKINNVLKIIKDKIIAYNKSYFKIFTSLNIHNEINRIISLNNIFNDRLQLLFEILKIM